MEIFAIYTIYFFLLTFASVAKDAENQKNIEEIRELKQIEHNYQAENKKDCQKIFSDIRKGKLNREAAFDQMQEKNCFVYVDEELYNILYTQILLDISEISNKK